MRKQLPPVAPLPAGKLKQWVAGLHDPAVKVRTAAAKELAAAGELARPALEKLWKKPPSVEAQRRARQLLDALAHKPTATELRVTRAVLALELADTDAAREVLRAWAAGAPGADLTDTAAGVLRRRPRRDGP